MSEPGGAAREEAVQGDAVVETECARNSLATLSTAWPSYKSDFLQARARAWATLQRTLQQIVRGLLCRFSCQLAITDLDYNHETTFSSVHSVAGSPPHTTPLATPLMQRRDTVSTRQRNLNVDISLGFQSRYTDPIECVDDLRQRLAAEGAELASHRSNSESTIATDLDSTTSQCGSDHRYWAPRPRSRTTSVSSQLNDVTYDTFEHCLQKANEMESLLAFYYQDEKNPNVMNVTEIFSVDEEASGGSTAHYSKHDLYTDQHPHEHTSTDLDWDGYIAPRLDNPS